MRLVVRGEGRQVIGGLEQHGREVVGQQLDFLVRMVDGHVVHPLEVGHRRVDEIQARLKDTGFYESFPPPGPRINGRCAYAG